jgi:hypothetical protein
MKTKGPVTEKEHTAFLNFWLEHFIFCGPSLAPTKNYLSLAYELARGTQLGIGKLFLGEVFRYLQLMSVKLSSHTAVKTGGPWWFIQLWAQLYFQNHIPNFPLLASCSFPDAKGKQIRCTSYGQALYSLPGSKLSPQEASKWFSIFFQGLDNPIFFPYTEESEHFENPISFRLDSFADDSSTRQLFSIVIRPCFLPVGMSTSNRIIKPGYEFYQPVVAARQFGLGQVSPHFFLHHLTESRADLPDLLISQRCYSFFDALTIPIPNNLVFAPSTDGFENWWSTWKTHAFRRALGPLLKQLDAEYDIPAEQVLPLVDFLDAAHHDSCNNLLCLLVATRWPRTYKRRWLSLRILPASSCGAFLQKLATSEKGPDAEPADFTKIGFQEQSNFRVSCFPSSN